MNAIDYTQIRKKFEQLAPVLDERSRRLWAAVEAKAIGYGGISAVSRATGLTRITINQGLNELKSDNFKDKEATSKKKAIRRKGGGRKKLTQLHPELHQALEALIEPYTRGDPMSPLRWTCKSTRRLAKELTRRGFKCSWGAVATMLTELDYSLQSNRKRNEGGQHPDRNAQFEYINRMIREFQDRGSPVISVDAKKKELVGPYQNGGKEWHPKGQAPTVNVYDFIDPERGKVTPYGVYDPTLNIGWVNVGIDHDTAEFAVESIWRWWSHMGELIYTDARELLILADGGGSNGYRNRLWKYSLQRLSTSEDMKIAVCHFPPGTSKWNKIEHRMFCHITTNWRGKPLTSHEVIVKLIGSTTTTTGLKIDSVLDTNRYPTKKKVTDEEMSRINIERADFHGEWNYLIKP